MVLTYGHMVSEQDTHVVHVALYQRTVVEGKVWSLFESTQYVFWEDGRKSYFSFYRKAKALMNNIIGVNLFLTQDFAVNSQPNCELTTLFTK